MQQMGQTFGQRLEQRMSQNQIQSLDVLAMPAAELREKITEELAENPALEAIGLSRTISVQKVRTEAPAGERHTRTAQRESIYRREHPSTSFSPEQSDAFQHFLENIPAPQNQSLRHHLREQLFLQRLDPLTDSFAERIIDNLTADGFHAVPLAELFKPELSVKGHAQASIKHKIRRALSIVRRFDPVGSAVRDFKQSQ